MTAILRSHNIEVAGIIKRTGVKRFIEVGTWKGRFCKDVLRRSGCYLNEYWALDNWRVKEGREFGRMSKLSQEDWDQMYENVCALMMYFPNLRILRMDSVCAASMFPDNYFDMVYIDTSHFYEPTKSELEAWEPKVSKYMSGHDYITPRKEHQGVKKAVDERYGKRVQTFDDGVWLVDLKKGN